MSSISSVSSSIYSSAFTSSTKTSRTGDTSKMAEDLFAQLDTTGKGYIEKSDLASAFSSLSSSTSSDSSASVDEVFSTFDSDSDGKVSESELASGLESLASALDGQYNQMRMQGAMPPPQSDEGFTQDELEQQLSETETSSSSVDSARSELLTTIVDNFDAADTDSDGKVTFDEAMAYDQSTSSTTASSTTSTTASSDSGFTLEELQAQLDEIGSSDSARSDLMSSIIANFDSADSNGDGTVSNAEAMAYDQSTSSTSSVAATSSSSSSSSNSSSTSDSSSELAILKRIMDLMQSYASVGTNSSNSVSVSA